MGEKLSKSIIPKELVTARLLADTWSLHTRLVSIASLGVFLANTIGLSSVPETQLPEFIVRSTVLLLFVLGPPIVMTSVHEDKSREDETAQALAFLRDEFSSRIELPVLDRFVAIPKLTGELIDGEDIYELLNTPPPSLDTDLSQYWQVTRPDVGEELRKAAHQCLVVGLNDQQTQQINLGLQIIGRVKKTAPRTEVHQIIKDLRLLAEQQHLALQNVNQHENDLLRSGFTIGDDGELFLSPGMTDAIANAYPQSISSAG